MRQAAEWLYEALIVALCAAVVDFLWHYRHDIWSQWRDGDN